MNEENRVYLVRYQTFDDEYHTHTEIFTDPEAAQKCADDLKEEDIVKDAWVT